MTIQAGTLLPRADAALDADLRFMLSMRCGYHYDMLAIGLAGAVAATKLMKDIPMVRPEDPIVFFSVATLLVAVGLFACWLPARRAAALHPVQALREE